MAALIDTVGRVQTTGMNDFSAESVLKSPKHRPIIPPIIRVCLEK